MRKIILGMVMVILGVVSSAGFSGPWTTTSNACTCLIPDLEAGLEKAKAVFVGEVVEIIPPRATTTGAPFLERAYTMKFKIEQSLKGGVFNEKSVLALQGDECFALPWLEKGEKYLVYAEPVYSEGSVASDLKIDACNRTAIIPKNATRQQRLGRSDRDREDGSADLRVLQSMLILPRHSVRPKH